jgi:A/G-specific adenine glycosylase
LIINEMNPRLFSEKVVEWYLEHRRALPWRNTRDPYRIWLSEIILQQTRVAQGLPYYRAFVKRYPGVRQLAAASEREVLRMWQGLGYYSRARHLRQCAKTVVEDFDGKFPSTFAKLRQLKGIGDYTAAAIASFAFNEPVAVVDGNVFRVLSRVFGVREDITSTKGKKVFAELANQLLPADQSRLHNEAVMEFGALHCTPRNPPCHDCPFYRVCRARRDGAQDLLPIKRGKVSVSHRRFYYIVLRRGDKWLMRKRQGKDIWKGLFDFPLVESKTTLSPLKALKAWRKKSGFPVVIPRRPLVFGPYRHVLTHQVIEARFVEVSVAGQRAGNDERGSIDHDKSLLKREGVAFYSSRQVGRLPKSVLISRYLGEREDH